MPEDNDRIIYQKKVGYKYTVYPNRIEIERPGFLTKRVDIILVRNISSVETKGMIGLLHIKTNDGKDHAMDGIANLDAKKMREALLSIL